MTTHPTEQLVAKIARSTMNAAAVSVTRFTTGLQHYVYDVTLEDGRSVVVRIAAPERQRLLAGALEWSGKLRPIGVPLPAILHADLSMSAVPFPYLVMERLSGTDLAHVYPSLSADEKRALALRLAEIQARVGALPVGTGFGYVIDCGAPFPHRNWLDAVDSMLQRSYDRIQHNGVLHIGVVERVRESAKSVSTYLAGIQPRPFLHDITTKNVIIHNRQLSGIVDVDDLCFGDPMLTLGLTNMALLARRYDTDYIAFWLDAMSATADQRCILPFYTAVLCVDFLGEIGHHFENQEQPDAIDQGQVEHFSRILDKLLASVRTPP